MTHFRLACLSFVMLTIGAQGQDKLEGRVEARRFVSEKYGFSMALPTGWSTRLSPHDTPVYVNYPASRDLPQLRLPAGGAMIVVIANETLSGGRFANTLQEWAGNDMRNEGAGTPSSPAPFEMPRESDAKNAIILSYDSGKFGANTQIEHEVAIYWEFKQNSFAAHLHYPATDPKGPAFEKVFLDTVRSIRPLRDLKH